jgi:hypothetical protein
MAAIAAEGAPMGWRSSEWALWFGWTLVFGLLFTGVMLPYAYDTPDSAVGPVLTIFAVSFVLCPIAAYKIGVRFPSPRWPTGPPGAIIATVLAILLLPASGLPMTQKDEFVVLLVFWGGWIILGLLALVYSLLARAGVKKGQRRGHEVATHDGDPADAASRRE